MKRGGLRTDKVPRPTQVRGEAVRRTRVRQEPLKDLDEEICFVDLDVLTEPFFGHVTMENDIMI